MMKLYRILFYTMTDKDTFFNIKHTLNLGGKLMDLSEPKVMGILNYTPDSFYQGSRLQSESDLLKKAEKMLTDGADILDLGAYSTRPGAANISVEDEQNRLLPAIKALRQHFPESVISVDTFRASVAEKAVELGAQLINDVSGGSMDSDMFETVGKLNVPYILMHMRGTPETMTKMNKYENMTQEILHYFSDRVTKLKAFGVKDIILDPGFGFAKNINQNYHLLGKLDVFKVLGLPVLAGLSRKSMVWKTLNISAEEALNGTSVLHTFALQAGASILRVHDVKEAKQCIAIYKRFCNNQ